MLVKQYSDNVNLDESVDKIKLSIFNKQGKIIGTKTLKGFNENNIPTMLMITYYRD